VCDSVYDLGNSSILYNLARFIEYAAILKKVLGCEFFCLNWCWKILFFSRILFVMLQLPTVL
jgi:hypothetical protein